MNFKDKSQVKIEVIYKLQSSHAYENPNSDENVQFLYNEGSDSLLAINQMRDYSLKLGAYKVFTEGQSNRNFYETMTDAGGECINPLLKGFNVALVSYGLKGRGKTQALFGPRSAWDDSNSSPNILSAVYMEVVKHIIPIGVSLNLIEISYNEDGSEVITDLLDFTEGTKDTTSHSLDFQGFTNVVIRSVKELHNLVAVAQRRSKNWTENNHSADHSRSPVNFEAVNNKAHLLCRMNFVNIREKKQFSFYLVDLIGADKDDKNSAEQVSLHQINKQIDDLVLMKDRIESYRESKLKSKKQINPKIGGYSTVGSSHQSRVVGFLTNIILSSQTFFFVPVSKNGENYNEILPIIEKCSKLNSVRYSIEKEYVDASRKIDIMSYQSFIKLAGPTNDSVINHTLNLSVNANTTPIASYSGSQTPAHFISGQLSPIPNRPIDATTKNQFNKLAVHELFDIHEVQDKVETATFPRVPQTFGEVAEVANFYEEARMMEDDRKTSIKLEPEHLPISAPQENPFSAPPVRIENYANESQLRDLSESKTLDRDTYFVEYKKRANEIARIMDEFLSKQNINSRRSNLPGEFYLLQKNFELLYGLFKEGEGVKGMLMNEFVDLGNSLNDLKKDYDARIEEVDYQCQSIQKKIDYIEADHDPKGILQTYEDDIERLLEKNNDLKEENIHLMSEVIKFCYPESRIGVTREYEILVKKHTHQIKQYTNVMKQMNEREQELNALRRKDRIFASEKKKIEAAQVKANSLAAELETKEDKTRALMEQLKAYERENKRLQEQVFDQEGELRKISRGYNKAAEEATLYQEMANAPPGTFIKSFKTANQSPPKSREKGYVSSKNIKELDHLVNKLRSFNS